MVQGVSDITIIKHLSSIVYEEQHLPIQLDTKLMITTWEREVNHIATGRALSLGGRTTPSSSWETATSMEMAVKSMETAVEAMELMEIAPGALPRPGRVPEQRLLSLEIGLRQRRRCGTLLGKMPIALVFSHRRPFIGGRAMSEGSQRPHTWWWHGQGEPAPPYGVPASWPPSGSPSDFVLCREE
jgi:hypothetical protein